MVYVWKTIFGYVVVGLAPCLPDASLPDYGVLKATSSSTKHCKGITLNGIQLSTSTARPQDHQELNWLYQTFYGCLNFWLRDTWCVNEAGFQPIVSTTQLIRMHTRTQLYFQPSDSYYSLEAGIDWASLGISYYIHPHGTKAVHLEVINDHSAESFIASLIPFYSHHDSGCSTNFVKAEAILQKLFNPLYLIKPNNLISWITQLTKGDQFHFNTPAAPHSTSTPILVSWLKLMST